MLSSLTVEDEFWSLCKNRIRERLSEQCFFTWIYPLEYGGIEEDVLQLTAGSSAILDYVSLHYKKLLLSVAKEYSPELLDLQFEVDKSASRQQEIPLLRLQPSEEKVRQIKKRGTRVTAKESGLLIERTFSCFVEGECNRLSARAARTVAQSPGENNYNPLVIYGGSGLGKTHLLHAIGNEILTSSGGARVLCISAEQFLKNFISNMEHFRGSGRSKFEATFRDVDVLLIDDIQTLKGKKETQKAFLQIFQFMRGQKKQIVISCDQPPEKVKGLHERLIHGFQSGFIVDLVLPDAETRLSILKQKVSDDPAYAGFSEEVLRYVAERHTKNIRELEGTLIRLFAYSSIFHREVSLDVAKQVLEDTVRNAAVPICLDLIAREVAREFEVDPDRLSSRSRVQSLSLPRKVAMYLSRCLTDNSLNTVGLFYNRNYATVISALNSLMKEIENSSELSARIESVIRHIKAA